VDPIPRSNIILGNGVRGLEAECAFAQVHRVGAPCCGFALKPTAHQI
jgi:hypothetical protein